MAIFCGPLRVLQAEIEGVNFFIFTREKCLKVLYKKLKKQGKVLRKYLSKFRLKSAGKPFCPLRKDSSLKTLKPFEHT